VSLVNGFTPTPGQLFTVLSAGSLTYNGIALGGSPGSAFYMLIGGSSLTLQAAGLPGDFNFDGVVDSADYVVWRKTPGYLPSYYDLWRAHLGDTAASGSSARLNASVPEPTAFALLCGGLVMLLSRRNRRRTS